MSGLQGTLRLASNQTCARSRCHMEGFGWDRKKIQSQWQTKGSTIINFKPSLSNEVTGTLKTYENTKAIKEGRSNIISLRALRVRVYD